MVHSSYPVAVKPFGLGGEGGPETGQGVALAPVRTVEMHSVSQ